MQELSYALGRTQQLQPAAGMATPAPASGSGKEVIIPGKLFRTILSILGGDKPAANISQSVAMTGALAGHNQRVKSEKKDIVK